MSAPELALPESGSGGVVALAGGVGAARLLRGLIDVVPPSEITAIVNTGDDIELYGVQRSPDIDIVTYTLGGVVDPERGFGLLGDRFELIERLGQLGHETWFRLGDRDFANCLHRSLRLRAGDGLARVSDDLRRAYGLESRILPMSEDACPTRVELSGGRTMHFEEYLVRDGAPDDVKRVDLSAAERAAPAPGVIEALRAARVILVCPSNPVVSIGPILAVPAIRAAISQRDVPVVAVSPIVGGAPIKGPADALLRGIGCEVSARGVAGLYRDWIDAFVLDERDSEQLADIEALGLCARATDTIMVDRVASARLARVALDLAETVRETR